MNKLVSVIVPAYGSPVLLQRALMSVLNQTYRPIELIVVDDNEPTSIERKQTSQIICSLKKDGHEIKYVQHAKNRNGAVARNTGLTHSKGTFVAFLDSDDEFYLDRLEKFVAILSTSESDVVGVYSGCEFRREGKKYATHTNVDSGKFLVETLACTFLFSTGSNIFVYRNVLEELNGFDEEFSRHQDYEFLARLFQKYSLVGVREVLVIKNNENFNLPDVEKMIKIKKQYLKKFSVVISTLRLVEQSFIKRKNYVAIVEQALQSNRNDIAAEFYSKARKYGRLSLKEYLRIVAIFIKGLFKA